MILKRCNVCNGVEKDTRFTQCQKCKRAAHPSCYSVEGRQCLGCREGEAKCRYCRQKGLLFRVAEGQQSHFICALLGGELAQISYNPVRIRIFPSAAFIAEGPKCESCKQPCPPNTYMRCSHPKCKSQDAVHFNCLVFREKHKMEYRFKAWTSLEVEYSLNDHLLFNLLCQQVAAKQPSSLAALEELRPTRTLLQQLFNPYCSKHKFTEFTYCLCKKNHSQENAVLCQRCKCWFFFQCLGYQQTEDDFYCRACTAIINNQEPQDVQQFPPLLLLHEYVSLCRINSGSFSLIHSSPSAASYQLLQQRTQKLIAQQQHKGKSRLTEIIQQFFQQPKLKKTSSLQFKKKKSQGIQSKQSKKSMKPIQQKPNKLQKPSLEKKTSLQKASQGKPSQQKFSIEQPSFQKKKSLEKPIHEKPIQEKKLSLEKPNQDKLNLDKPSHEKPHTEKPSHEKPSQEKPTQEKPNRDRQSKPSQDKHNKQKASRSQISMQPSRQKQKKRNNSKLRQQQSGDKLATRKEPEPIAQKSLSLQSMTISMSEKCSALEVARSMVSRHSKINEVKDLKGLVDLAQLQERRVNLDQKRIGRLITAHRVAVLLRRGLQGQDLTMLQNGKRTRLIMKKEGLLQFSRLVSGLGPGIKNQTLLSVVHRCEAAMKKAQDQGLTLLKQLGNRSQLQSHIQNVFNLLQAGWCHPDVLSKVAARLQEEKIAHHNQQSFSDQLNRLNDLAQLPNMLLKYSHLKRSPAYLSASSAYQRFLAFSKTQPTSLQFLNNEEESLKVCKDISAFQQSENETTSAVFQRSFRKLRAIKGWTLISLRYFRELKEKRAGSNLIQGLAKLMEDTKYPDNRVKARLKSLSEEYSLIKINFQAFIRQPQSFQFCKDMLTRLQAGKIHAQVEETYLKYVAGNAQELLAQVEDVYHRLEKQTLCGNSKQVFQDAIDVTSYSKRMLQALKISEEGFDKLKVVEALSEAYKFFNGREKLSISRLVRVVYFIRNEELRKSSDPVYLMHRQSLFQIKGKSRLIERLHVVDQTLERQSCQLVEQYALTIESGQQLGQFLKVRANLKLLQLSELQSLLREVELSGLKFDGDLRLQRVLKTEQRLRMSLEVGAASFESFRQKLLCLLLLPVSTTKDRAFFKQYNLYVRKEQEIGAFFDSQYPVLTEQVLAKLRQALERRQCGRHQERCQQVVRQCNRIEEMLGSQDPHQLVKELAQFNPSVLAFYSLELASLCETLLQHEQAGNDLYNGLLSVLPHVKSKKVSLGERTITVNLEQCQEPAEQDQNSQDAQDVQEGGVSYEDEDQSESGKDNKPRQKIEISIDD